MKRGGLRRRATTRPPRVLFVGGTDPCGGAGVAADVRTAAALGCHALVAIAAVTVQDSRAVHRVAPVPPGLVGEQIAAALDDAGADCVKIGMLGSAGVARAVAAELERRPRLPVVLDPVLRATTGGGLLDAAGMGVVLRRLVPRATLVTPNLPEAAALLGRPVRGRAGMRRAAEGLRELGARAVLLKGGHLAGDPVDLFSDGRRSFHLGGRRIATRHTHGSGCVLAAAVACLLARGAALHDAVRLGRRFVAGAIRGAYPLGSGRGPVNPAAGARVLANVLGRAGAA